MIIKFIVTWIVVTSYLVPCPPPAPRCDDYGRCGDASFTTAQACYDSKEKPMSKEFATIREAEDFVWAGKLDSCDDIGSIGQLDCLKNFKILEVKSP